MRLDICFNLVCLICLIYFVRAFQPSCVRRKTTVLFLFLILILSSSVANPKPSVYTKTNPENNFQYGWTWVFFHKPPAPPPPPPAHSLLAPLFSFSVHSVLPSCFFSHPSPRFGCRSYSGQYAVCWRESRRNCCQMTFRESDGGETKKVGLKKKGEKKGANCGREADGRVREKEKSEKREKKVAGCHVNGPCRKNKHCMCCVHCSVTLHLTGRPSYDVCMGSSRCSLLFWGFLH